MFEAFCFATVMLLFTIGVVVTIAWFMKWASAYREWTEKRKYPQLWYEVPALVVTWALLFWLGVAVLS